MISYLLRLLHYTVEAEMLTLGNMKPLTRENSKDAFAAKTHLKSEEKE